jgi:hypothetical protein
MRDSDHFGAQSDKERGRAISGEKYVKDEHDFSRGERGKFHDPKATFSFPVYLEPDVDAFLSKLAEKKEVSVQELVNEWLRMNIQLVQSVQQQG